VARLAEDAVVSQRAASREAVGVLGDVRVTEDHVTGEHEAAAALTWPLRPRTSTNPLPPTEQ
jgi:hypothetical protein